MRFYNQHHRFYCGVDLHARTMYLCIRDSAGTILFHKNLPANAEAFLLAIAPYRDGLVVACECMFAWYWLADLCAKEGIPFVLGHALYLKAIHGGKTKNDKLDADKHCSLLRGGNFPTAYVYPKGLRETRDLLRRRLFLVRQRAHLVANIQNTNSQPEQSAVGRSSRQRAFQAKAHGLPLPTATADCHCLCLPLGGPHFFPPRPPQLGATGDAAGKNAGFGKARGGQA